MGASVALLRKGGAAVALFLLFAILALAMGLGSVLSRFIQGAGLTLPAYIGAMIVASGLRNLDEATGRLGIDEDSMEFVGGVALNVSFIDFANALIVTGFVNWVK